MTDKNIVQRLDEIEDGASITKDLVKEAIKEWLDEQFLLVGKWTVKGIVAAGLAALLYFILAWHGLKT